MIKNMFIISNNARNLDPSPTVTLTGSRKKAQRKSESLISCVYRDRRDPVCTDVLLSQRAPRIEMDKSPKPRKDKESSP